MTTSTTVDDHVATQVRHLAIVVVATLLLAILGFVVLGNTAVGQQLSFVYPVALVGTAGGTANAARRVQRLQQEPLAVQAAVPQRLALAQTWLSPVVGGTFAALLYCIFLAGILQGEFFPAFDCAALDFTDYQTFSSCQPATNADAAMALVWGFVAGFFERFVPNVLDRFIGEASGDVVVASPGDDAPGGAPVGSPGVDARTGPFREPPTLLGEQVELRPFTSADAPAMARILSDPEVVRLTGSATTTAATHEPADLDELVDWYGTRQDHHDRLDLAIVDRATGAVVGEVVLNDHDEDASSVNFRILVGPGGRGRGLGTEAARLVLDHAFRVVGLRRVELEVHDFNPRARHVYESLGFVHEGTRRSVLFFDGHWVDAHVMALLDDDWDARTT